MNNLVLLMYKNINGCNNILRIIVIKFLGFYVVDIFIFLFNLSYCK